MYFLWVFTCHRIPAFLMDVYMRIIGKKPRMLSMYRKIHRSMDTLAFFTQRHWEWEVKSLRHMQQLIEQQSSALAEDKGLDWGKEWNTSVKDIDWQEYLGNFCLGTKCFVLNEEMSDLHLAKQKMSRSVGHIDASTYLSLSLCLCVFWMAPLFQTEDVALCVQHFHSGNSLESDNAEVRGGLQVVDHVRQVLLQVDGGSSHLQIRHSLNSQIRSQLRGSRRQI